MIGIVRLALRRPYTFIVMALLILIFGTASALRTPTDIFPNINIPVISVVFSYTGLPADDMAGRIVTFYERSLPNSVNDIEHIESQSIVNYGIIKIFFHPPGAGAGSRCRAPASLRRQGAPGPGRSQPAGAASIRRFRQRRYQFAFAAESDHAGRNPEDRLLRVHRQSERLAESGRSFQRPPGQDRQRHRHLYA